MTPDAPDIQEAVLDQAQLRALLEEVASADPSARVIARNTPGSELLCPSTHADTRRAMQIRYRFKSANWVDTFIPSEAARIRLIRAPIPSEQALPEDPPSLSQRI